MTPVIFWFRADLRLSDLPGLIAAASAGTVIPCFILDEGESIEQLGSASRWWLHQSLTVLSAQITRQGGQLVLKRGDTETVLSELARMTGAKQVMCSRRYTPAGETQELRVFESLATQAVTLKRYPGSLLFEPGTVLTGAGTPFKVFTPFWRACMRSPEPPFPKGSLKVTWYASDIASDDLRDWHLEPSNPNWAASFHEHWVPGEQGAQNALQRFLSGPVAHYAEGRDQPAEAHTSRLSPHLRFGEISPRQIWHAAQQRRAETPAWSSAIEKFLAEIGWREFCYQLLDLFPEMPLEPFKAEFKDFPWQSEVSHVHAWQRGATGYPIVDAGMRELWRTGFMHNRVRMIVASFLCKHLLTHWREGERWFWDTLVDADIAANTCSWQWVAGSGADAAPYFRIFNPIAQGEKFDTQGEYVRRWCPEIAALPNKYIHKPWEATQAVLDEASIVLGEDYPLPIVDHAAARERALGAYQVLRALNK